MRDTFENVMNVANVISIFNLKEMEFYCYLPRGPQNIMTHITITEVPESVQDLLRAAYAMGRFEAQKKIRRAIGL